MTFVLDTCVAIDLRDGDPVVTANIVDLQAPVYLSMLTRIELEGGVYSDMAEATIRLPRLLAMLDILPVLPFDDADAEAYRAILARTGYSRREVFDRMIAAQALTSGSTLITKNAAAFNDIPGLKLLAW